MAKNNEKNLTDEEKMNQINEGGEGENATENTGDSKGGSKNEPKVKPSKDEELVEVPKSTLEIILKKQEELEKARANDKELIDRLTYAADKSRLGIWDERNSQGELIRTYGVGIWKIVDDKGGVKEHIVRGTKMIADDVVIEDNGGVRRLVENQTLKVYLDDGVDKSGNDKEFIEIEIPYVNFYRLVTRKRFPVIKESKTTNGEFRTLRLDDGREIELDIRFLNY